MGGLISDRYFSSWRYVNFDFTYRAQTKRSNYFTLYSQRRYWALFRHILRRCRCWIQGCLFIAGRTKFSHAGCYNALLSNPFSDDFNGSFHRAP